MTGTTDERFAAKARAHPGRVAVVDGAAAITYRELWDESERIADLLAGAGVPAGGLVGLRAPRGWRTIAAILAVWRHGCGYVPVDPDAPAARQRLVMDQAALAFVLVDGADGVRVEPAGTGRPAHPVPEDVAYVIFTSGSTGVPKGVVVTHRNVLALVESAEALGGDRDGIWSQAHTHNFDFSVWEMWVPLLSGGTTVVVPAEVVADGAAFAEVLRREQVAVLNIVPSVFRRLLAAAAERNLRLPDLRRVILGGEAVDPGQVRRWWDSGVAEAATLHNMYGITECTVHVTTHALTEAGMAAAAPGTPIGDPLPHLEVVVLDGDELYVSGAGVAHGYLGRDDLTEERFVRLAVDGGAKIWYRTGDRVRVLSGGGLAYLGRVDDQVKIRGIRVEPAETERALLDHPAVVAAEVVAVRDAGGEPVLAAAVVPAGARVPAAALRDHVLAVLPPAFVPATIRWTDGLPTTESGKVDRAALVALLTATPDRGHAADDVLARLWVAATADGAILDEDAGFLSLGGHSLTALRFLSEVEDRFHVRLPVSVLLRDNGSLTDVRALLADAVPEAPQWTPPVVASSWPLTSGQRRMWTQDRLDPDPAAYNVVASVHCPGAGDEDRAVAALLAAVTRHPALRARLRGTDTDEPTWVADTTTEVPVRHLTVADEESADACAAAFAAAPFDLRHEPPVRLAVLRVPGAAGTWLVICLHHIVSDQRTLEILLDEFARLHEAPTVLLPPPARQEDGPADAAGLRYWTELLRDTPGETAIPFRTRGTPGSHRGTRATVVVDAPLAAAIDALAATAPATAFATFTAALAVVLAEWSGQDTLVFGVPSSNRRTPEQHRAVGFFLDTLPVRVDVPATWSFRRLLRHVRDRFVAAVEHGGVPFDDIVGALGGRTPVFNVWLNDLTRNAEPPVIGGVPVRVRDPRDPPALFDLNLYLNRHGDGYRIDLVGAADRVPAAVVDALATQLRTVLAGACADPDRIARRLDLAPPAPCAPVVATAGQTLHQMTTDLLAAARRRGQATALETPEGMLTFTELADRVAALATRLREAGVGPAAAVEVVATRTAGLPTAMLACWSLGAVPCLVDARWPEEQRAAARELLDPCCVLEPDPRPWGRRTLPGAGHVLFTSGTSGTPSAVVAGAAGVPAAMRWYHETFGVSTQDRVALLSGPAHDPVLRDVLVPLLAGGTCVVPPADVTATPARLANFLSAKRITVLHATPPLLRLLLAALREDKERLDALRLVVSGGAALTADLVAALRRYTTARVVNAYGMTESPQIALWHPVTERAGRPVPVGAAVPGVGVTVRTADGRDAAVGQRGELVLRGRIALGYLDDYLDEAGRTGVFGADADGPVLRTGDLGRVGPDGLVYLDGRADRQVQLHGFRVELAAVESAATRHPLVDHAVARPRTDDGHDVLELDVAAGGPLEAGEVIRFLRAALPPPAVPSVVRIVGGTVLDHNNKPAPREEIPGGAPTDIGPTEGVLAAVREVLGRTIPVDENFFDAGMTSMSVLRLCAALAHRLDRAVPVTDPFEHPTVRALAGRLAHRPPPTPPPTAAMDPWPLAEAARRRRLIRRDALLERS